MGMKKQKNEALEESEKRLVRLVEADPDNALAWYELGQVQMDQGQYGKARECFKEALAIQPDNDFFRKGLIECLVFLGDNESAEREFRELAGEGNEREEMLLRASKFLHAERRSLKKVTFDMTGDPANLDTWLSAAETLLREGKLKEAEAAAVVGVHAAKVEDTGTFMGFWNVIGRIMHAMNRHRDEANAFLVPFSMDHQSAAAAALAEALIECGEDVQAQRVLEKAVEEGTQVGQVYMCLGRRYWDIDRRRDAARMYRRGTQLEPQNTHWSLGYISLLVDIGELDEAEKEIDRVRTLDDGARWADYYTQVVKDRREELSGDLVIVRRSRGQLPRLIRDSGFIVDWIHREVEGVQVVQANLCTASRAGRFGHYAVTGMCVSMRGRDLQLIRHQVEERLQKRAFMYHDYEIEPQRE